MALLGLIPDPPKDGVQLRLTAQEAKKEATGRALILIGSTIGITGSILVLQNNPIVKQEAEGLWQQLPEGLRRNKPFLFMGLGLTAAFVVTTLARRKATKYWKT